MQIKKDDTVVVIAGKDKGKTGQVLRTIPKKNKVVVEGVNMQTKHAKATRTSGSEIKHMEGPIDASNVMFYDKEAKSEGAIEIGVMSQAELMYKWEGETLILYIENAEPGDAGETVLKLQ